MTNLISWRRIGPLVMLSLEAKIAVLVKGAVWVANPSSNATISSQLCASSCTCKHINAHTHDWSAVLAPWVKAEYLTNKHNWSSSKSGKAEEPALVVIYDSTFYSSFYWIRGFLIPYYSLLYIFWFICDPFFTYWGEISRLRETPRLCCWKEKSTHMHVTCTCFFLHARYEVCM